MATNAAYTDIWSAKAQQADKVAQYELSSI